MMKFTITLAATFNVAAGQNPGQACGPVMPMPPLQYTCPDGSQIHLNDLTKDNWALKSCTKSRSRRALLDNMNVRLDRPIDRQDRCWFHDKCSDDSVFYCAPDAVDCQFNRKVRDNWYCVHHRDSPLCEKVHNNLQNRNNEAFPGEDPEWVSEEEQNELAMDSPYNMVVNIVNVESPFHDEVRADGLDQINKLVKSILISLFKKSFNAKYLFILEGSNTAQVYHALSEQECPSWTNLQNGLMTVDEATNGQKAIPSKLSKDLGYEHETWDAKFSNILGYLEDNVDTQHQKIMVNHFQFARNAKITEEQAMNSTAQLDQWRATMASKGGAVKEMKLAFHFIGSDAEHSFIQLEDAMKGKTNSQSISFKDGNDNSVRAIEFDDNILLLNYDSGVNEKLERPDVFPILKIMKSFIDYDSYFDLRKMSSTVSEYSGSTALVTPLLSLIMIAVATLLF